MGQERTKKLQTFIEELGMIFEGFGLARMSGRVLGWLLVSDPPHQSASQLAEVLQASKGSISSSTRILIRSGLVERLRLPGDRKTYYVVKKDVWSQLTRTRDRATTVFKNVARRGLDIIKDDPKEIRERLEAMHHIHAFSERERPKLMQRWKEEWEQVKDSYNPDEYH